MKETTASKLVKLFNTFHDMEDVESRASYYASESFTDYDEGCIQYTFEDRSTLVCTVNDDDGNEAVYEI